MILFSTSDRNCQEITGKGENLPQNCPANYGCLRMLPSFLRCHSNSSTLLLLSLLDFEDSDDCSYGSQEPDKQLTSPEVMAWSNSSD
jgi:hypothetical protein